VQHITGPLNVGTKYAFPRKLFSTLARLFAGTFPFLLMAQTSHERKAAGSFDLRPAHPASSTADRTGIQNRLSILLATQHDQKIADQDGQCTELNSGRPLAQ
jgi:hypothetical protein